MRAHPIVLVTGSTRGIGKEIALRFAEAGAVIGLNYVSDQASALQTLMEVQQIESPSRLYRADVARAEEAKRLLQSAVRDLGRIDILINNAGPMLIKPLAETSPDEWDGMIQSNLSSAYYCSKYALEFMRDQAEGQILNIGCLHGEVGPGGLPNSPAYGIAKSAVLMLTRMLARSEAKYNIRVNAISPGPIETPIFGRIGMPQEQMDQFAEQITGMIPAGRFGQATEIAEAVVFLASPESSYVLGAEFVVDGGMSQL